MSCGIDTKSNTASLRCLPWIWHYRSGFSVFTIPSSWLKGVLSTTVSWYGSSFLTPVICLFFGNSVDVRFSVAPELIIAIAVTLDNLLLLLITGS